jgi:hypothetical protein
MNQVSVMFDAPARSGNHLAVATLADSFPDIKFYWGYPNQHSPKSFALPKEKAKHILTVLRNPLDSIISVVVVWKLQTKESILSAIEDNKKMLESMLDNVNGIHISSFEDLTNNTPKYIDDVSKVIENKPVDLDYDEIKDKLQNYYPDFLYVAPINNQLEKNAAKELLLAEYKNEIDECIELYKSLQQYVIQ